MWYLVLSWSMLPSKVIQMLVVWTPLETMLMSEGQATAGAILIWVACAPTWGHPDLPYQKGPFKIGDLGTGDLVPLLTGSLSNGAAQKSWHQYPGCKRVDTVHWRSWEDLISSHWWPQGEGLALSLTWDGWLALMHGCVGADSGPCLERGSPNGGLEWLAQLLPRPKSRAFS